jgi:hypothetical protein
MEFTLSFFSNFLSSPMIFYSIFYLFPWLQIYCQLFEVSRTINSDQRKSNYSQHIPMTVMVNLQTWWMVHTWRHGMISGKIELRGCFSDANYQFYSTRAGWWVTRQKRVRGDWQPKTGKEEHEREWKISLPMLPIKQICHFDISWKIDIDLKGSLEKIKVWSKFWKIDKIRNELDQTKRLRPTVTFADHSIRSYSSLKMTCLKMKLQNHDLV